MLTGDATVEDWMRGYRVDPILGKIGGSGRGARNYADVSPRHYADWAPETGATAKTLIQERQAPADETSYSLGDMIVRNLVTGELRPRSQVWAEAAQARYHTDATGKVVAGVALKVIIAPQFSLPVEVVGLAEVIPVPTKAQDSSPISA